MPTSASVRFPPTSRPGSLRGRSAGPRDRSGHRCRRRPEHRSDPRRTDQRHARRRPDHGHRAVRVRHAPRHERHAGDRRQPVRHHHRHQPDRRPPALAWCGRDRHRQPPQQRSHRQGRRRAVHLRWSRRRDERRVDQGLLRPGRSRRAAVVCDRRGHRHSATPVVAPTCSPRCASSPTRCARC